MKESLKGRRFECDEDLEEAATKAIEGIPVEEFRRLMEKWLTHAHKCLQFNGGYFEGL